MSETIRKFLQDKNNCETTRRKNLRNHFLKSNINSYCLQNNDDSKHFENVYYQRKKPSTKGNNEFGKTFETKKNEQRVKQNYWTSEKRVRSPEGNYKRGIYKSKAKFFLRHLTKLQLCNERARKLKCCIITFLVGFNTWPHC